MRNAQKTKKVFFTALFFSLAMLGLYFYGFSQIINENKSTAQLSADVERLTKEKDEQMMLKTTVAETELARKKLSSYFIPSDGLVPFLNRIQLLGEENGLELKVGSVVIDTDMATTSASIFETVRMSLDVTGEWSDVHRLVSLLDLMPLKIFIDRADLEKIVDTSPTDASKKKSKPNNPL